MSLEQGSQAINRVEIISTEIPITKAAFTLWRRRKLLATLVAIGAIISMGIAFVIPPRYTSTIQLMPVSMDSLSARSSLGAIEEAQAAMARSSLMNTETPTATAIGMLKSETELDGIIRQLNLRGEYNVKTFVDARNVLLRNSTFSADKSSGIVKITVTDRDRYRSQRIGQAYIEQLNQLIGTLNSSSAHRERLFLESRLASIKADLDEKGANLSEFSSKTGTLNPQAQGQALITSTAQLQSQLILAQTELQVLKTKYTDSNPQLRQAFVREEELRRQIQSLGTGTKRDPGDERAGIGISLGMRQLPVLGVRYEDLTLQLRTEEAVYQTLTKQYEMAKVQEAKELPTVKILDSPDVPEKKSSPKRALIVILGTFISLIGAVTWLIGRDFWVDLDEAHPAKLAYATLFGGKLRRA